MQGFVLGFFLSLMGCIVSVIALGLSWFADEFKIWWMDLIHLDKNIIVGAEAWAFVALLGVMLVVSLFTALGAAQVVRGFQRNRRIRSLQEVEDLTCALKDAIAFFHEEGARDEDNDAGAASTFMKFAKEIKKSSDQLSAFVKNESRHCGQRNTALAHEVSKHHMEEVYSVLCDGSLDSHAKMSRAKWGVICVCRLLDSLHSEVNVFKYALKPTMPERARAPHSLPVQ